MADHAGPSNGSQPRVTLNRNMNGGSNTRDDAGDTTMQSGAGGSHSSDEEEEEEEDEESDLDHDELVSEAKGPAQQALKRGAAGEDPSPPPKKTKSAAPPALARSGSSFKSANGAAPSPRRQSSAGGASKVEITQDGSKGRLLSCTECRRRKTRCDKKTPCGPCILRGDQARCKQIIRWESGCSLSEFQMLQNRVADLEARLDDVSRKVDVGGGGGYPATLPSINGIGSYRRPSFAGQGAPTPGAAMEPSAPINAPTPGGGLASGQAQGNSSGGQGRDGGDDAAVMMLEDFAMGNRVNTRRAAQTLTGGKAPNGAAMSPAVSSPEMAITQRSADPAIDVAYRFLSLAPPPDVASQMVAYYFERLDWYTKCLYRPSYEADAAALLALPPDEAARTIRPAFICIHMMVLCLSLHLCGPEDVARWGMTVPVASALCDNFYSGAQQLLWASDFIGSHQLEHLQAVILMSVYAYNVDDGEAAYALCGAAIKIAQNLGLNRLDDARAIGKSQGLFGSALGGAGLAVRGPPNPIEREMKKRVWWYFVWLDYSHAMAHGGAYAIHPLHNRTMYPANIDDASLATSGMVSPKPLSEYTDTSFTIHRLRFLEVYREIIDLHNSPRGISYKDVLDMDKKLSGLLEQLPTHFQLRMDERRNWSKSNTNRDLECLSMQLTAHNRLLRLHRPYLIKGFSDRNSPSSQSTRRCVAAAFAILEIMRHAKLHAPMVLKTWIHIYYGFGGALVIFLALCYEPDQQSQAAEEKRSALREMAEICSTAGHLSAAAKNTGSLLRGLIDAELEIRRPTTSDAKGAKPKRKRSATNEEPGSGASGAPFLRLVERVLVDAASRDQSLGRSPSDPGFFEPPHKRHSTSYVRDGRDDGGLAGLDPSVGYAASAGAGGFGSFGKAPASPWGGSSTSSRGGGGGGGGKSSWGLVGQAFGGGQTTPGAVGGPQAASGLSNLLDEDIFSGLLMGNAMDANDWENALAFVAAPHASAAGAAPAPPLPTLSSMGSNAGPYPPSSGGHGGHVATPPIPAPSPLSHHSHHQSPPQHGMPTPHAHAASPSGSSHHGSSSYHGSHYAHHHSSFPGHGR